MTKAQHVTIPAPNYQLAAFNIVGTSPLVIHRFSAKAKTTMRDKMEQGSTAGTKKPKREPLDIQQTFNEARYISSEGWDGFNAASIRNGSISACRLVGFKMTIAKLSIFVIEDGRDKLEPQYALVRILDAKAVLQEDIGRVETGQAYLCIRPVYHNWKARLRIRYDADQFTLTDIGNLLLRVGQQIGIGEGRYDSKESCGMGWGCFEIEGKPKAL